MPLKQLGYVDLPEHIKPGGFDHAAVAQASRRLYVAHTANDALDVIDCEGDEYLYSIPDLTGVAGALVSEEHHLVFTSNRGENTVGIFSPDHAMAVSKVKVGLHPNGLAYAAKHRVLLAANVGDPTIPHSYTVSLVDVKQQMLIADIAVQGRTRWTIFDAQSDRFYINIADPAQIVVVRVEPSIQIERIFEIPAVGPHGLDFDAAQNRLFCACDGKQLLSLEASSGQVLAQADLSGAPDVIFFNAAHQHLYVAIGEPGVIDVFDTQTMRRIETVATEVGAHTLAFDAQEHKIYAFLPKTHRAAVYVDVAQ